MPSRLSFKRCFSSVHALSDCEEQFLYPNQAANVSQYGNRKHNCAGKPLRKKQSQGRGQNRFNEVNSRAKIKLNSRFIFTHTVFAFREFTTILQINRTIKRNKIVKKVTFKFGRCFFLSNLPRASIWHVVWFSKAVLQKQNCGASAHRLTYKQINKLI